MIWALISHQGLGMWWIYCITIEKQITFYEGLTYPWWRGCFRIGRKIFIIVRNESSHKSVVSLIGTCRRNSTIYTKSREVIAKPYEPVFQNILWEENSFWGTFHFPFNSDEYRHAIAQAEWSSSTCNIIWSVVSNKQGKARARIAGNSAGRNTDYAETPIRF